MTRDSLFLIFLLLAFSFFFIPFSYAAKDEVVTAKAFIALDVVNQPPRILNVTLLSPIYRDTVVSCDTFTWDEHPDKLKYSYKWFLNQRPVGETSTLDLNGLNVHDKDVVTCTVEAEDDQGDFSYPASSSQLVTAPSLLTIASTLLNWAGCTACAK